MIHDVSIPAVLVAGIISFLLPCVLPLVPPYLIYLTGATIEHVATGEQAAASKRAVMLSALLFVLGFSTVFIALGASASVIGGLIRAWSAQVSIVAGIGAAEAPSGERRTGNGCIVGRDGGCVPDRKHVGHQHLAA
jgi:cytochrome c-type biogenesis protein